jgi:hypothetical protein
VLSEWVVTLFPRAWARGVLLGTWNLIPVGGNCSDLWCVHIRRLGVMMWQAYHQWISTWNMEYVTYGYLTIVCSWSGWQNKKWSNWNLDWNPWSQRTGKNPSSWSGGNTFGFVALFLYITSTPSGISLLLLRLRAEAEVYSLPTASYAVRGKL